MEQRFEMEGGGTLHLSLQGARVRMTASRNWDRKGLYKVWLLGRAGGQMRLGTLVPEGDKLWLKRSVMVTELERHGCWPVQAVRVAMAFAFPQTDGWYCEKEPGRWIADAELRQQLKGAMLCLEVGEGRKLAVPFRSNATIPLVSLFCFAQPVWIEGNCHLVWSFDREGAPVLPEGRGEKWAK